MSQPFWELVHPGGPRGFVTPEPVMQEQDREAQPGEGFVVAFFPKITGIGPATLDYSTVWSTLSQTPEAAISKFMDGIKRGEAWETYQDAGHRVRKVRLIDLGDAA